MKYLSVMIKPASSICNLNCSYCFYDELSNQRNQYSYGIMEKATVQSIIQNIFSLKEPLSVSFVFQGGEPTMAGLDFFRFFLKEVNKTKGSNHVEYAIQTNGTLLDDSWCAFLKENDFLVGLSLDMMENNHDKNRKSKENEGTYERVLAAKNLLDQFQVRYNILTVLTNSLANYPDKVWKYMTKHDISFVQFVPCLSMDASCSSSYALTPERFFYFYSRLFELWSLDFKKGRYRSVKLFDDLIHLLADGSCNACGLIGKCFPQIVVESDGSVYPCDFYATDKYEIGNLSKQGLQELLWNEKMKEFAHRSTQHLQLCQNCRYVKICGGGCPKMRQEVCGKTDGKTCGYQSFLDFSIKKMERYAMQEFTYLYKYTTKLQ